MNKISSKQNHAILASMQRMKSIFSLICILSWPDLDVFLQDDGLGLGAQLKLILYDFLVTVKAATLIFISGRGSAISSAKKGKSGFIYILVNS